MINRKAGKQRLGKGMPLSLATLLLLTTLYTNGQTLKKPVYAGNPVIDNKYTADPAALVYKDFVYLYSGHDEAPGRKEGYLMNEWLCFSSADTMHWKEHSSLLNVKNFTWASGDAWVKEDLTLYTIMAVFLQREQSVCIDDLYYNKDHLCAELL